MCSRMILHLFHRIKLSMGRKENQEEHRGANTKVGERGTRKAS